jgi:hypothetical protein
MTKFKDEVVERMRDNAERKRRERDEQHLYWLNTGGLLEAIRYPELLTPPSERTAEQIRAIVMREIERKRLE